MFKNVADWVKGVVIILLVVIIIASGMVYYSKGKEINDTASNKLDGITKTVTEDNFKTIQDGDEITGTELINFIRANCEYADIDVITKDGSNNETTTTYDSNHYNITSDVTDDKYIPANKKFTASGIEYYNDGKTISEIEFEQEDN